MQSHREMVTTKIFDSVRELLYQRGYDAISLAEVAEAAGMSRTAMYNYFSDKAALVIAFATHETEQFIDRLDAEMREHKNPVDQLRAYVRLQLEYFSGRHLPPGPTLRLLLPEPSTSKMLAHVGELESRLEQIVVSGRDLRFLLADDVAATVALISACISRGSESDAPLNERIATTEGFVLRAVGAQLNPDGTPKRLRKR